MPDAVIALSVDGKINFVSVQLQRILKYDSNELIGKNIDEILSTDSMHIIHRLIKDLVAAEHMIRVDGKYSSSSSEENSRTTYSGSTTNYKNAAKSSAQMFPLLEVNVDDELGEGTGSPMKKYDGSPGKASTLKHKPSSLSIEANIEGGFSPRESIDSNENVGLSIDNVMGAPVTKNNESAKLSSLMHCPKEKAKDGDDDRKPATNDVKPEEGSHIHRKIMMAHRSSQKQDSQSSSTDSDQGQRARMNSSEDSRNRDSNESSSDGYDQDSSSISGSSSWKKGNQLHISRLHLFMTRSTITHTRFTASRIKDPGIVRLPLAVTCV